MNGMNNCDKTDREYSLAPTDDLVVCWRSTSRSHLGSNVWWAGGEDIHVDAGASKSTSSMLAVVMKCL